EERADGPVDEARGERFLGARPGLALDVPAGELAGGAGPLPVLDLEWKEVDALADVTLGGGRQDHGVAQAGDYGPVGLLGELTGLENEGGRAQGAFDAGSLHLTCP